MATTTPETDSTPRDDSGWQMALDVWGVLERHGFKRGTERDAAHSVVLLMAMAEVYTGRQ